LTSSKSENPLEHGENESLRLFSDFFMSYKSMFKSPVFTEKEAKLTLKSEFEAE
jgi:hypothetical protein